MFAVDVCQAGTAVPPGESGPLMYKGTVYPAADVVIPDMLYYPCESTQGAVEHPPVAVFRIQAATVKRAINVSTCGVADADNTIIEVRRIDVDKAGECVSLNHTCPMKTLRTRTSWMKEHVGICHERAR